MRKAKRNFFYKLWLFLENGAVGYGILKETGLEPEDDDRTEEAMKLLREKGYKIIKEK